MALLLNQMSGMPQMNAAFSGWKKTITLKRVTQQIVDGFVRDYEQNLTFEGTVQPLSSKDLKLKPEGERSFEWLQIHAIAGANNLNDHDRIIYNNKPYKVMGIWDYSLNNYIEYHLIADYDAKAG